MKYYLLASFFFASIYHLDAEWSQYRLPEASLALTHWRAVLIDTAAPDARSALKYAESSHNGKRKPLL